MELIAQEQLLWQLSWTSVDISQLRSCGIHLNKILHEMVVKLFDTLCVRTLHTELKSHLAESVGLNLDAYKPGAILLPIWWMYWNWLMPNCFRGFPSIMLRLNCTCYQHETQAPGKSSFKWHQIKIPKFPVQSYWMVWCKLQLLFLINRSIYFFAAIWLIWLSCLIIGLDKLTCSAPSHCLSLSTMWALRTQFHENLIEIKTLLLEKMHFKMLSAWLQPLFSGLSVVRIYV